MAFPTIEQAKQMAIEFCQPPKQPQMITLSKDGTPRIRTLGASLQPDWVVNVFARRSNGRAMQIARNPYVSFVYSEFVAPINGQPQAPKVVILQGKGRLGTLEEFGPTYKKMMEGRGEAMPVEEAFQTRTIIICAIEKVRMEGFAAPGETLTFPEITSGLTFDI